jgi:hypothetical protein
MRARGSMPLPPTPQKKYALWGVIAGPYKLAPLATSDPEPP